MRCFYLDNNYWSGKGGYGKRGENMRDNEIIFAVVTRLEVRKLQTDK